MDLDPDAVRAMRIRMEAITDAIRRRPLDPRSARRSCAGMLTAGYINRRQALAIRKVVTNG